jgi:hypothetical protein
LTEGNLGDSVHLAYLSKFKLELICDDVSSCPFNEIICYIL